MGTYLSGVKHQMNTLRKKPKVNGGVNRQRYAYDLNNNC